MRKLIEKIEMLIEGTQTWTVTPKKVRKIDNYGRVKRAFADSVGGDRIYDHPTKRGKFIVSGDEAGLEYARARCNASGYRFDYDVTGIM